LYTLSEINIYPIKSLAGISLQSAEVEERGLKYDRRWMLVENENKFITQREHPQMALLQVAIGKGGLSVKHKIENTDKLFIPFNYVHSETKNVIIWNDIVSGFFYNHSIDEWFSDILNVKCRLVYMLDSTIRKVNPERVTNKIVSFADGYPFLIIGQASLGDLNSRLPEPLPMNRFRPNLVFTGGKPYEEDNWKNFKIGEVKFRAVKPSIRCVITTTNQETAERTHEPLHTLSKYRKINNGVIFGMNLVCESVGRVSIGDKIELL
jgi:uncharacterized protein YcbX